MLKIKSQTSFVLVFGIILSGLLFSQGNSEEKGFEEKTSALITKDSPLYDLDIPLDQTENQRNAFKKEFLSVTPTNAKLRPLYEKYIDRIGANGIIHELEGWRSTCHLPGHALGMVIFSRLGKIRPALRTCRDACNSACMHGVFMESFKGGHSPETSEKPVPGTPDIIPTVKAQIGSICSAENLLDRYKPGDCAHGVGHAIMHIVNNDIPRAMENCRLFDQYPMQYYCATGAYMQYVGENDKKDTEIRSAFYPCDSNDYPAACFRYKMVHVMRRVYKARKTVEDVARQCMALEGKYRLGCFHGIGNAHMGPVTKGMMPLSAVCRFGTDRDQYACIDGAVERMGKYHPEALESRCRSLAGWRRELCLDSGRRGMYALDKPFKYYPR